MISGYDVGTEVKWNDNNALQVGVIEKVFTQSQRIQLKDRISDINVGDDSPTYLISTADGEQLILRHQDVMLKSFNHHT